jgi:hypothetical protein
MSETVDFADSNIDFMILVYFNFRDKKGYEGAQNLAISKFKPSKGG